MYRKFQLSSPTVWKIEDGPTIFADVEKARRLASGLTAVALSR